MFLFLAYVTPCSSVTIVNFEQVNAGWEVANFGEINCENMITIMYKLLRVERNYTDKIIITNLYSRNDSKIKSF